MPFTFLKSTHKIIPHTVSSAIMLALKTTCYGATDILGNNLSINTNFILRTLNFIYEKLGENRNSATWESINHIHRIQNHQLLMISKMKKKYTI